MNGLHSISLLFSVGESDPTLEFVEARVTNIASRARAIINRNLYGAIRSTTLELPVVEAFVDAIMSCRATMGPNYKVGHTHYESAIQMIIAGANVSRCNPPAISNKAPQLPMNCI
jgi:hypothetical protein